LKVKTNTFNSKEDILLGNTGISLNAGEERNNSIK
jgi:hypothetical protein